MVIFRKGGGRGDHPLALIGIAPIFLEYNSDDLESNEMKFFLSTKRNFFMDLENFFEKNSTKNIFLCVFWTNLKNEITFTRVHFPISALVV